MASSDSTCSALSASGGLSGRALFDLHGGQSPRLPGMTRVIVEFHLR